MIQRTKHRAWGAAIGGVVPAISFVMAYYMQYSMFTPVQYVQFLASHEVLSKVLSLCVLPNLIVFFIALTFDKDSVAFGTLFGTMVWAIIVAVLYFAV